MWLLHFAVGTVVGLNSVEVDETIEVGALLEELEEVASVQPTSDQGLTAKANNVAELNDEIQRIEQGVASVRQEQEADKTKLAALETSLSMLEQQRQEQLATLGLADANSEFFNTAMQDVWGGKGCEGYWQKWGDCKAQCYQVRHFYATSEFAKKDENCVTMPFHGQPDYRNCNWGECKAKATTKLLGISSLDMLQMSKFTLGTMQPASFLILVIILSLGLVGKLNSAAIPDAVVIMIVAACYAAIVRYAVYGGVHFGEWIYEILQDFVEPVMHLVLLPITIYEGGFNIQRKNFFSQLGYGVFFAVIGTIFSAFAIAAMIVYTGPSYAGWHTVTSATSEWREAICYSSFIADVDPVATLAAFGKLQVEPLLQTLVGGEATLNDPVAIVLFEITNVRKKTLSDVSIWAHIGNCIQLLVVSVLIGLVLGLLTTVLQRFSFIRGNQVLESTFLVSNAYVLYAAGEMCGYSGIIVSLFGGLVHGVYARANLSPETEEASITVLSTAARASDILIFAIVGFCFIAVADDEGSGSITFGLLTVLFCLVARAVMLLWMIPVVNLIKKMRGSEPIPMGIAVMIWHSQLRGGMTLLLALLINPYWTDNKPLYVDATIICVVVMAMLCGFTCPKMLDLTKVPYGIEDEDGSLSPVKTRALAAVEGLDRPLRAWLTYDETEPEKDSAHQASAEMAKEATST